MKIKRMQLSMASKTATRWGARALSAVLLVVGSVKAWGQIYAYEAADWPENEGWVPAAFCEPPRRLVDGWFEQQVGPCPGDPLPGGQQEAFRRGLGEFVGNGSFFIEWQAETTGPSSEIDGVAPASVVIAGNLPPSYHFTFARDQVRLIRSNLLPIEIEAMVPGVPYVFRLELRGEESYAFYIDKDLIDMGVPEGEFPPNDSAVVSCRAKCWYEPSVTRWSYVRYGVIPQDASGDYDSDEAVTMIDHYFVVDCLTKDGPGIFGGPDEDAGPGCRFADFDADTDVDLLDFAEFQNGFGG